MVDSAQLDALTDEQRERIAQNVALAIVHMSAMGQEAAALFMRWAEETLPIIQGLCAELHGIMGPVLELDRASGERVAYRVHESGYRIGRY